jgi:hypothetical protein
VIANAPTAEERYIPAEAKRMVVLKCRGFFALTCVVLQSYKSEASSWLHQKRRPEQNSRAE